MMSLDNVTLGVTQINEQAMICHVLVAACVFGGPGRH